MFASLAAAPPLSLGGPEAGWIALIGAAFVAAVILVDWLIQRRKRSRR
jgi:hypothetical protein